MARTDRSREKNADDAWQQYAEDPQVRRTADLHAAAFAFGELRLHVDAGCVPVLAGPSLLRQVGVGLYVAGSAFANIETTLDGLLVPEGTACEIGWSAPGAPDDMPGALSVNPPLASELLTPLGPQDWNLARFAIDLGLYCQAVQGMKDAFSHRLGECSGVHVRRDDWEPPLVPDVGMGYPGVDLGQSTECSHQKAYDCSSSRRKWRRLSVRRMTQELSHVTLSRASCGRSIWRNPRSRRQQAPSIPCRWSP